MISNLQKHLFLVIIFAGAVLISCKKDNDGVSGTRQGAGTSANDILSDDQYTSLRLEILYPEGFNLESASLSNLRNFINEFANKPGGIQVSERVIPPFSEDKLSAAQIRAFEDENREFQPNGSEMSLFVLLTNTGFSQDTENSRVLGIAYRSTSICLFQETIIESSNGSVIDPRPSKTTLETTVVQHEIGHLFGLVNNGTDMVEPHQDEPNGAHCTTEDCLMYFQVETTADLANLMGGNIPELDNFCRADVAANGGK